MTHYTSATVRILVQQVSIIIVITYPSKSQLFSYLQFRAVETAFHATDLKRVAPLTEWRMQGIGPAMPAIRDRAVIEAKRTVVQLIAQLLRTLLEGIATLDSKIEEAAGAHPDYFIFQSLPRAGAAWAPRLSAALGSQRDRYASAVQKYSGIAPVTERSRKKKWHHRCGQLSASYALVRGNQLCLTVMSYEREQS